MPSFARWTIVACLMLAVVGCSDGKVKKKSSKSKTKSTATAETSTTATEPAVETPPPPPAIDETSGLNLDSGRIRAFSPVGWRRASKSRDYLVRYQSSPLLAYPTILVVAADPPDGFTEITKGNHKGFVAAIASRLAEEVGGEGKPKLVRAPTAVTVGKHFAANWLTQGEAKLDATPKTVERECMAVVVNGRMYTVEIWAPVGKLDDKAKEAGRAVTAALAIPSLEPGEPLAPFSSPPPADEPPAEKPKAPAAAKPSPP